MLLERRELWYSSTYNEVRPQPLSTYAKRHVFVLFLGCSLVLFLVLSSSSCVLEIIQHRIHLVGIELNNNQVLSNFFLVSHKQQWYSEACCKYVWVGKLLIEKHIRYVFGKTIRLLTQSHSYLFSNRTIIQSQSKALQTQFWVGMKVIRIKNRNSIQLKPN